MKQIAHIMAILGVASMLVPRAQAVPPSLWIGLPGASDCQPLAKTWEDIEFRSPELGTVLVQTTNGGQPLILIGAEARGTRSVVARQRDYCVAALRFANLPVTGAWGAVTDGATIAYDGSCKRKTGSMANLAFTRLKDFSYAEDADGAFTSYFNDGILIVKRRAEITKTHEIIAVDGHACELGVKLATRQYLEPIYKSDYDALSSVLSMEKFLMQWRDNDFDQLVPKVEQRLKAAKTAEYEAGYREATTYEPMSRFIEKYRDNDPKGYVAAINARIDAARTERQLRYCLRAKADAEQAIQRQKDIGRVSGYVNTQILYQAGEIIMSCNRSLPADYQTYRKQGGKKTLRELR